MTVRVRLALIGFALTAMLVVSGAASGGKGGPSPGVELGGTGIAAVDGTLRYVARSKAGLTTVTAYDRDGQRVRQGVVGRGVLGIPRVAFDGTLDGLAHDGRSLVLASAAKVERQLPVRGPLDRQSLAAADDHAARLMVVRRALA